MQLKMLCEYMENPVGLSMERPRFSWSYDDTLQEAVQESYRILVKEEDGTLFWDSGVVASRDSANVFYQGKELQTAGKYTCQVETTLNNGDKYVSEPMYISMGLMGEDATWKAEWIGGHHIGHSCYWYRSEFTPEKKVKRATAFIQSTCYYVFTVNGQKADDTVLNNATSDYPKTIYYTTVDITKYVVEQNALGMCVGYGWENLRLSEDGVGWEENSFSFELLLEYEDGTSKWIYSDLDSWYYKLDGPILYNSIYNGEGYDAREELTGFDLAGYEMDDSWHRVVQHEAPGGRVKSAYLEPIRVVQEMEPVQIYELADGSYTLDFGQNFAGWVRLSIQAEAGTKIELQYAELEHEDHSANTISLRTAKARDTYICKGEGVEVYEPRFTFHGFRYVQVFGLPEKPEKGMFIGCVVRSDVKRTGYFNSSNALLNQIYSNVIWTEMSNLHSVPTDCPQRDERLGWLNDMTVRNECAIYNFNLAQLYEKWMQDIRDTQGKHTGAITDTAPFRRYGARPADAVSSSFLLVPWNIYNHYGDVKIIEENYDAITRWVAYLLRNSDDYVVRYSQMGDWAGPVGGTNMGSIGGGAISTITPTILMGTGFLYYDCMLLARMAKVLGKESDIAYYEDLAEKVKDGFNHKFLHEEGYYATDSQASNVFPMYLGIVPKDKRESVMKHIVEDINKHGNHLTCGNLCSRYSIEVLLRNGEEDLAYEILDSTEYPGWGYMVANGATTIWERWERVIGDGKLAEMASYNHPMNGAMAVSFGKHMAGILVDEEHPAFEHFVIKPVMPKRLKSMEYTYESVKGTIRSAWEQSEDQIRLEVQIPVNTTADVYVPVKGDHTSLMVNGEPAEILSMEDGYARILLKSGRYTLQA